WQTLPSRYGPRCAVPAAALLPPRAGQHGKLRRQRNTVFAGQIDVDKDRVGSQLGTKTQARLTLFSGTDHLYLPGLVKQFRQEPGSQGLIFDNNSSDPDPHEKQILAGRQFAGLRGDSSLRSKLTASRFRKGMRIVTVVPSPISLRTSS